MAFVSPVTSGNCTLTEARVGLVATGAFVLFLYAIGVFN